MTGIFTDQSSDLTETLQSMRDVLGLQGSFVVSDLGRLLARDMPALFADDVLAEVGPRALRLRDTMGDGTDSLAWCVVRYPTNVLCMRPLRDGLLIVLTENDTNLPALRMAMSHSIRRLNALLDGPSAAPPGPSTAARQATVSATASATVSAAGAGDQTALGRRTRGIGVGVPAAGHDLTGASGVAAPTGLGAVALTANPVRAEP
jgi:predicted regulator of Ras-like GTPase activity (Roadblock/LC7/MglB family)